MKKFLYIILLFTVTSNPLFAQENVLSANQDQAIEKARQIVKKEMNVDAGTVYEISINRKGWVVSFYQENSSRGPDMVTNLGDGNYVIFCAHSCINGHIFSKDE